MPGIKIEKMTVVDGCLKVAAEVCGCKYSEKVHSPKVSVYFQCEDYIRRLPMAVKMYFCSKENGDAVLKVGQRYVLDHLFEVGKSPKNFSVWFALQYGAYEEEKVIFHLSEEITSKDSSPLTIQLDDPSQSRMMQIQWNGNCEDEKQEIVETGGENRQKEELLSKVNRHLFRAMFQLFRHSRIQAKKVFFLSNRRSYMSGNMEYVYDEVKKLPVKTKILLKDCDMNEWHPLYLWRAAWNAATAKVILVDDSCNFLDFIDLKKETSLIQLWHACGAFKTFGYSRLGKSEGPDQRDRNHRFYTHAITSSAEIGKFYAEGFGIPLSHVSPTGVPRTDVFFDKNYKQKMEQEFYQKYPSLHSKKVILFAPTFRGWDKESAYYPIDQFRAEDFLDKLGEEYALIIKYHPYISQRYPISEEYSERILDMTESAEINDLLFVSDLVITDYSSVIFEASLLNIPMLFYAYDLNEYISARDFYYEFEDFVPGRIVQTQEELIEAVRQKQFDFEKINAFKKRFFDHLDGKSAWRVAQLVLQDIQGENSKAEK